MQRYDIHERPRNTRTSRGGVSGKHARALLILSLAQAATCASAADDSPVLPHDADHVHLGVATCAGSTCHGAAEPREGTDVLQNEYLTWHRRDAHAGAYEVLHSDRSRSIAERLDLGPAHEADACLECHADNVPPERRGRRFQITDGIGCEACHGGAEDWIRTHASGETSHEENLANGLYPTERPGARARLCMSCHYSHPDSPMTHRIMGAGHPPLLFELDTFTQIQPPHHRPDADYRERKGAPPAAAVWAAGQAVGATVQLEQVRADLAEGGLFPELYHFDCNACHHQRLDTNWISRPVVALPPGTVPLEDASLRMLGYVLSELYPQRGRRWTRGLARLHRAVLEGSEQVREAAGALHEQAREATRLLRDATLDTGAVLGMGRRILEAGEARGYADRTWADQCAMALASLLATLEARGGVPEERLQRLTQALDGIYRALSDPDDYSPWRLRQALQEMRATLP